VETAYGDAIAVDEPMLLTFAPSRAVTFGTRDCAGVRAVRDLPGVSDILVAQLPTNGYGAKITCI
jgi:hypothetical protein